MEAEGDVLLADLAVYEGCDATTIPHRDNGPQGRHHVERVGGSSGPRQLSAISALLRCAHARMALLTTVHEIEILHRRSA